MKFPRDPFRLGGIIFLIIVVIDTIGYIPWLVSVFLAGTIVSFLYYWQQKEKLMFDKKIYISIVSTIMYGLVPFIIVSLLRNGGLLTPIKMIFTQVGFAFFAGIFIRMFPCVLISLFAGEKIAMSKLKHITK